MRGFVSRPSHIRYRGFDVEHKLIERTVAGFHATVFLHENDHLDGVLYTDRIEDMSRFGFADELAASGVMAATDGE